jgi:hypothetical protein
MKILERWTGREWERVTSYRELPLGVQVIRIRNIYGKAINKIGGESNDTTARKASKKDQGKI